MIYKFKCHGCMSTFRPCTLSWPGRIKCHGCMSTCTLTIEVGDERVYSSLPPMNCCPTRDPQEQWEVVEHDEVRL